MKNDSPSFLTSAADLESCPESTVPEVAFIGRSNVGKSCLVNLLTKQKNLAKVSNKPGKTKLINFFSMGERWTLVDLPGYGYAKVAKGLQASFNEAVSSYLYGRTNLKLILVLVDSRYEPVELDLEFLAWLQDCPAPHALVFTKIDQVSRETLVRHVDIYRETLSALGLGAPEILACSSTEKLGRSELLAFIEKTLPPPPKKSKKGISLGWMK